MSEAAGSGRRQSPASLALDNLRAYVILLVLAFHSSLAYLAFLPARPFAFDSPPFQWRAFPIVDAHRSIALELFCAWQDVFLMTLFFFLSGLFVWPSLQRKGIPDFIADRMRRLALPFALSVALLMPVAQYPTYLQTAASPGVADYLRHFLALPFWPCGPMWFLWLLLCADLVAVGLHAVAPRWGEWLARLSSAAGARPIRYFAWLLAASAVAYVPLALAFTTEAWGQFGPFSFQLSRPLHYALYFFAGAGLGAYGIERGLFAPSGLSARWRIWLGLAVGSFALWLALTALVVTAHGAASLPLQVMDALSFVLACLCNCFGVLAAALRFAARRRAWLDELKQDAYGMYLVHYLFVIWLQYALLPAAMPAVAKALAVFAGTLALSWGTTAACRRLPARFALIGRDRRVAAGPS
ncbi:MAG TPA: acyltransferase [Stellaceae bacterium]|jgi:peptidoglycan/LPS O-acetylase OafA/YrhL|nr:acyltransferase [Stellaceae bacterium]